MTKTRSYNGGKHSLFNKWYWENWSVICKRIELDYFFIPCMEKNSKWIKDLNVRPDIIKIGNKLFAISFSIFYVFLQAKETRAKVKQQQQKMGLYESKKLLNSRWRKLSTRMKRPPTEYEKLFTNDISDRGLIGQIYKDIIQLNIKKRKKKNRNWLRNG